MGIVTACQRVTQILVALYVTYAPDGIMVKQLLGRVRDTWESIRLFSPSALVEPVRVLGNSGGTTLN